MLNVRVLKLSIAIMTGLIVLCLGVIVTTVARRSAAPTVAASGLVAIPAGAAIEGEALDGKRLLLRLRLADGRQRLLIIDTESGRPLGHLDLVTEPATGG